DSIPPASCGAAAKAGYGCRGCRSLKRSKRQRPPLFAEAKPGDDFAVPVHVAIVQVAELTAPLANKHQETTTCVVIVLVRLQVRRQVLDPFSEDRDLDFMGACIGG